VTNERTEERMNEQTQKSATAATPKIKIGVGENETFVLFLKKKNNSFIQQNFGSILLRVSYSSVLSYITNLLKTKTN
jgi:hypothetical protein